MSRNGAGIYSLPAGQPVVTGTTISSTTFNTLTTDLANALTTSLASDGQTTMSGNLPMGGFKATGLGAATIAGDAVRFEQAGTLALSQGAAASGAVTASGLTQTTARLLGRTTAATGAIEEITVGSGLTFAAGSISIDSQPGFLFGCTLSTVGSSATMSISAGRATDNTGLQSMALTAIAKTTSSWAVGTAAGGLDTGAIANSTWYHYYVIRRPDTGVVDGLFSLSATAPTLPTNYTQFRRIGSGLINSAGQWTLFQQFGDWFDWDTPVKDVDASGPGTSAVTRTLSVPTGVVVIARVNAGVNNSGVTSNPGMYLSSLDTSDLLPSISAAPLWASGPEAFDSAGGARRTFTQQIVKTNTSAQIRSRISVSDANVTVRIATTGWLDTRGRNS